MGEFLFVENFHVFVLTSPHFNTKIKIKKKRLAGTNLFSRIVSATTIE